MHPDRLVAPSLAGLPVSSNKQPRSLPPCPPLFLGERHIGTAQRVTKFGEPATTPTDRHRSPRKPRLHLDEPCLQVPQATQLGEPLSPGRIPSHPALAAASRHRQARPNHPARSPQPGSLLQQIAPPTRHWSLERRVMAPAHRLDE